MSAVVTDAKVAGTEMETETGGGGGRASDTPPAPICSACGSAPGDSCAQDKPDLTPPTRTDGVDCLDSTQRSFACCAQKQEER